MERLAERTDYTLRDPSALGALLVYDWRLRRMLTDQELLDSLDGAASTSMLRNLQRQGLIRALHGVRPQGGRMRLWTMADVLKVQAGLDLSRLTGTRLTACADRLAARAAEIDALFAGWERLDAQTCGPVRSAVREADAGTLFCDPDALSRVLRASICGYLERNRFDQVRNPAFLL
ncbi:MAG: hypothetical protein ACFE0P_05350 [Oceanicaulis sp.]